MLCRPAASSVIRNATWLVSIELRFWVGIILDGLLAEFFASASIPAYQFRYSMRLYIRVVLFLFWKNHLDVDRAVILPSLLFCRIFTVGGVFNRALGSLIYSWDNLRLFWRFPGPLLS